MITKEIKTKSLLSRPVDSQSYRTGVKDHHSFQAINLTTSDGVPYYCVCLVRQDGSQTAETNTQRVQHLMETIQRGMEAKAAMVTLEQASEFLMNGTPIHPGSDVANHLIEALEQMKGGAQ